MDGFLEVARTHSDSHLLKMWETRDQFKLIYQLIVFTGLSDAVKVLCLVQCLWTNFLLVKSFQFRIIGTENTQASKGTQQNNPCQFNDRTS